MYNSKKKKKGKKESLSENEVIYDFNYFVNGKRFCFYMWKL